MRAYMVYDPGPGAREGAILVFAPSGKDARSMGYATMRDWFDSEWCDIVGRWLEGMEGELARQNGVTPGAMRVIESPVVCPRCETWGNHLDEEGVCEPCRDDEEAP